MPLIAAKFECDHCHKTVKDIQPFALMRGGKLNCSICAHEREWDIYTWFSPIEAVSKTCKPTKLDPPKEAS
jgi:transcription elongation factor Elf1